MASFDWTIIVNVAAVASTAAAAVSAYLSYRANRLSQETVAKQLEAQNHFQKEQFAAQSLLQYVDLNLRYPKFSTEVKWQEYSNFVFGVLTMSKLTLDAYPGASTWSKLVKEQLSYHDEELAAWKDKDLEPFGEKVQRLVAEVVSERPSAKVKSKKIRDQKTARSEEPGVVA